MSKIRSKDTQPERKLRAALFKKGFRYRIHKTGLPGRPDIVLPKYRSAIFIHGCFWHQHENCKNCFVPKTRQEYWLPKLQANIDRDKRNVSDLTNSGWAVIVVWECEIKKDLGKVVSNVVKKIKTAARSQF